MVRGKKACCGTTPVTSLPEKVMELPEQIQRELEEIGGFEALSGLVPSPEELDTHSRVHQAMADPHRLSILYLIRDQPLCVCVINRFTRLSGSKLSYHLNILKEGGLIEGEYHGNWIIYSLTNTGREYLR